MHAETASQSKSSAYALHKSGDLTGAARIYEQLLATDGNDADVLGLLALCKLQAGQAEVAYAAWEKCASLNASTSIKWRNANNFIAAKLNGEAENAEGELAGLDIPVWPENETPSETDIRVATSLLLAMQRLGRHHELSRTFSPFAAALAAPTDHEMDFLRAAVEAKCFELITAFGINKLDAASTTRADVSLLLSAFHHHSGDVQGSRSAAERAANLCPVYVSRSTSQQRYVIGVANKPQPAVEAATSVAAFHFGENTPTGLLNRFSDRFQFASFFPFNVNSQELARQMPRLDFIMNNWVTAETLRIDDRVARLSELFATLGRPVLNPPERAAQTTRQIMSEKLQGIPNLVVPKVVRFENASDRRIANIIFLEQQLSYPMILRDPFQQMGGLMTRVSSTEDLMNALHHLPQTQIYAIEFIDNPVEENIYRKLRAAVVGDDIFITHVLYREHWNVHRERDERKRQLLLSKSGLSAFADAVTSNPASVLGMEGIAVLRDIHRQVGLDIYGIDFDVMSDGKLLFFEANAAMHIAFGDKFGFAEVRRRMFESLLSLFGRVSNLP